MSPSSWSRRVRVIVLAVVGCGVASYLTLYQLRLTSSVWDPWFGPASSEAVLNLARPIPDALLGAVAYVLEAILTAVGGQERWRTNPRLVLLSAWCWLAWRSLAWLSS